MRFFTALAVMVLVFSDARALSQDVRDPYLARWDMIDQLPDDLGLIAVIDNPGELLSSDDGRTLRTLLASTGLFTQTFDAWSALSAFLSADSDELVDLFFSGTVTLAIADALTDPFGQGLDSLSRDADRGWALIADVSAADLDRINSLLDPVPREIVSGIPLYSIEKGRFSLVLLNRDQERSRVVLAPRGAQTLAKRLVASVTDRADARAERQGLIPEFTGDPRVLLRLEVRPEAQEESLPSTSIRIAAGMEGDSIKVSFTSPDPDADQHGSAPTELFDVEGAQAIGVAAFSSGIAERYRPVFEILFPEPDRSPSRERDPLAAATGYFLALHERASDPNSLDWLLAARASPGSFDAVDLDRWVERRFVSGSNGYEGAFPRALRTETIAPESRTSARMLGESPSKITWRSVRSDLSDQLVMSLSDDPERSYVRAERVSQALELALMLQDPDRPPAFKSVSRGWIDAQRLSEIVLSNTTPGFEPIASLLGELRWDIKAEEGFLSGDVSLGFDPENDRSLGIGTSP